MNCEHMIMKRHGTSDRCRNAARFFYHSVTGVTVHLCGVHARTAERKGRLIKPIDGTVQPVQKESK